MIELFMHAMCNNRCINCGGSFDDTEYNNFESFKKIIDSSPPDEGITLVGGEPTMHKDFFKALGYVNSQEREMLLLTNARAFSNEKFAEHFDGLGLSKNNLKIGSAIYGQNRLIHELMSRTPGSFNQTISGIKRLIQMGYRIELRIIVTKLNYRHLKDIAEFVSRELKGVEQVTVICARFTLEALKNKNILYVPYKEAVSELIPAVKILNNNNFRVQLFHYPHCTLPKEYRKYSGGRTVSDNKLHFKEECKECKCYKDCSGIWKSNYDIMGDCEITSKNV